MGRQGHSCWLLAVDNMEVLLSVSDENSLILGDESEVESVELIEEDELSSEGHVVGDDQLWGGSVFSFVEGCAIPLREIRCASILLRYNSACGGGP